MKRLLIMIILMISSLSFAAGVKPDNARWNKFICSKEVIQKVYSPAELIPIDDDYMIRSSIKKEWSGIYRYTVFEPYTYDDKKRDNNDDWRTKGYSIQEWGVDGNVETASLISYEDYSCDGKLVGADYDEEKDFRMGNDTLANAMYSIILKTLHEKRIKQN